MRALSIPGLFALACGSVPGDTACATAEVTCGGTCPGYHDMLIREHDAPCPWYSCYDDGRYTGVTMLEIDDRGTVERFWFASVGHAAEDSVVRYERGDTCQGQAITCSRLERSDATCQEWGE